jgi:lambda repressor-like predicted transcriptional regulator
MHKAKNQKKIKILLIEKGISQAAIARSEGISSAAVSQVISGVRIMPRVRAAIAEACGVPVEELWPAEEAKKIPPCHGECRGGRECDRAEAV